jgi:uroporphyrinogen decarboxylase
MEKIFDTDRLTKRERVERTLNLRPVDRVAIHDQLSYNAKVISLYTGKPFQGFEYDYADICTVIRQTLDACFPVIAPLGTARLTNSDGFVIQHDNWHSVTVARPFGDVAGAREFLLRKTDGLRRAGRQVEYGFPPGIEPKAADKSRFEPERERENYHRYMRALQVHIGETVIIDFSLQVGFCDCWSQLGLDTFIWLYDEDPQVVSDYIEAYTDSEIRRLHAIANRSLSPVILIPEDFASKSGLIFSPAFLRKELFPRLRRMTEAWHSHGVKVIFHSDGNFKRAIPDLVDCGVDGFYCLEPAVGMDIVALKKAWPDLVWAGGIDGVDLMEGGTPEQVRREVRTTILETGALQSGGIFVGTSSEVNPLVRPENFKAMVDSVGEVLNPDFTEL